MQHLEIIFRKIYKNVGNIEEIFRKNSRIFEKKLQKTYNFLQLR